MVLRTKKWLPLALSLGLSLTACSPTPSQEEAVELTVFAAASLTETLTQLGELYTDAHPNVTIQFNFDSSGHLKSQIEAGADCDLFLSASPTQMNQLDLSAGPDANPSGLDFVMSDTRLDLLENQVTLAVPEGNPKGITSFQQLSDLLQEGNVLLGMGNSDVPVGQYTLKIFDYYGLKEEELVQAGVLTYGSNVKEVTTQVTEGAVDCGIIYSTDAASAGLSVVDQATAEMCGQVIYPAAVMKNAPHPEEAGDFLSYLQTEEAGKVFRSVGFLPCFS